MSIRCVIIDDEKNNVALLGRLLKSKCSQLTIVGQAENADEGKAMVEELNPELIFLDIQMPGKTGFEMLTEINGVEFEVIFITAFDEYAIKAMKFSAVDYLLKPIDSADLVSAVERAIARIHLKHQNKALENLIMMFGKQHHDEHRIALPTTKEVRFVKTDQIIRCESSNNYCNFFLIGGEQFLVSKPIYEYESLLSGYGFVRCHQSHIVNKKHIKSLIKESGGWFLMEGGKEVPISKSKKEILKNLF